MCRAHAPRPPAQNHPLGTRRSPWLAGPRTALGPLPLCPATASARGWALRTPQDPPGRAALPAASCLQPWLCRQRAGASPVPWERASPLLQRWLPLKAEGRGGEGTTLLWLGRGSPTPQPVQWVMGRERGVGGLCPCWGAAPELPTLPAGRPAPFAAELGLCRCGSQGTPGPGVLAAGGRAGAGAAGGAGARGPSPPAPQGEGRGASALQSSWPRTRRK